MRLVHRSSDVGVSKHADGTLDLPPAAEVNDVAEIPAAVGTKLRLAHGMIAETLDQIGRVGQGRAVVHVDMTVQLIPQRMFSLNDVLAQAG